MFVSNGGRINNNRLGLAVIGYRTVLFWQAREEVEMRVKIDEMVAQEEKKKKEEKLRQLAQEARDERAGIKSRDRMYSYSFHDSVLDY